MNLNDLPDEVLEQIFDHLDLYELKLASLVCRRWAKVTFSGRRMDRVWFLLCGATWKTLLNIKRPYRNIHQLGFRSKAPFKRLSRFLQTLKLPVRRLKVGNGLTLEELRLILLEVPELQDLCIAIGIKFPIPDSPRPFPQVLTKLKCLKLDRYQSNLFDCFRMNVANLQSLYMSCGIESDLEIWRYVSGQLKLAHVYWFYPTYFFQFFELTFPHLEDLTIKEPGYGTTEKKASSRSHDFFRRHSLLRRLSVDFTIPVEWIRSITRHCAELTYLYLFVMNMEEGILESLTQLTKLRHLSFLRHSKECSYLNRSQYTKLDTKLFRGAIKSLESVELEMYPTRVFLENLFEAAPQLNSLEIKTIYDDFADQIALDFEFICEKFSCLRRLELDVRKQVS
ncbi:uncharacterized protein LOC128278400 [Anopheles cruzii]|uniref:uncharacterized protein LOC128278400 n=1 Tax=Anopheles cruzii TaxID=68878 RepID=UPI0022EC728A|nr:uncharacterized protein LOC128278400 [Anopheles cruzii]